MMNQGPCNTVGKGGVGESGSSVMLTHSVASSREKLVQLRTTNTDLCPNTGVAAMIVVNGTRVVSGDITANGASVQTTVQSGDSVVAIAHTVPLFNGIACVRLGEAQLELQECDLVEVASTDMSPTGQSNLDCSGVHTKDWNAWINRQPPEPNRLIVVGDVQVPNPGVEGELNVRIPQGINPNILLLNLTLNQRPGFWPQVIVWKQVRFERIVTTEKFDSVEIFCGDQSIAQAPVQIVQ